MTVSYLSLGSNIGDRLDMLRQAVQLLTAHPDVKVERISSVYETDPVGFTEQAAFLNMVVQVDTVLSAFELLELCHEIEQKLNRKRLVHWGPRTIDLDILLYNHDNMESEKLTVPHPRMHERAFVLVPLLELEPSIGHPTNGRPFTEDLKVLNEGIQLWKTYRSIPSFLDSEEKR